MTTLVIGTQNSGKSALAEEMALRTPDLDRYYVATMKICDEDAMQRVQKHRAMREGKGFVTIERETGLRSVTDVIENPAKATVLLECMANLVGNEMHENGILTDMVDAEKEEFAFRLVGDVCDLAYRVHNLIVVTNEYADDPGYDAETRLYVELLHLVNEKLRRVADRVIDLTDRKESRS